MEHKVAIVTGSTQGLGESIARKLVQQGLSGLVLCGRNESNGKRLEQEFSKSGCHTIFVKADFLNITECENVVATTADKFDRIDILVNSAGITDRSTLLETSHDLYDRIFAINVKAPFFLMKGVAKIMIDKNIEGNILNIISMSSYGGQPFLSAYSTSKGALLTLTKNTAFALMRDRIRVNGINLGWTDTPGEDNIQKKYHKAPNDWLQKVERDQPFGKLIKPEDVAELACFILQGKSGILTGAIIDYDQSVNGANYLPPRP